MTRQNFLKLLTLKISGEISVQQQKQFDEAVAANPEYQLIATQLLQNNLVENVPKSQNKLNAIWADIAVAESRPQTSQIKRRFPLTYLIGIAAAVLIIICAGLVWQKHRTQAPENMLFVNAANHKLYQTLDDGTSICLNAGSVIQYNPNFGKSKREIKLRGEAFFDVAKNPAVPLFIHVGPVTIEVKGTAFNILEHSESKEVEIALIRGKIEVSRGEDQDDKIALNPHQRMIVSANTYQILPLDTVKQTNTLQWTRDSLVFKKEKLVNLALLLEKKYQVKIEIKNEKLKLKQFSGVIKKEQLTEALDALKLSYPFSYVVNNKVVIIK